jgi:limonene-1,2-epoxide hydrolase
MEWIIHNLAVTADGSKVLTERTDGFYFGDQRVSVPVMGVFEFRGELIAAWRGPTAADQSSSSSSPPEFVLVPPGTASMPMSCCFIL